MRAIVIIYNGTEIPDAVLTQMMVAVRNDNSRTTAEAFKLDENDVVNAMVAATAPQVDKSFNNDDQIAINRAADYISELILKKSKNYFQRKYSILSSIFDGDSNMLTAVEIIATKSGIINDPLFTPGVYKMIKSIYKEVKDVQ